MSDSDVVFNCLVFFEEIRINLDIFYPIMLAQTRYSTMSFVGKFKCAVCMESRVGWC